MTTEFLAPFRHDNELNRAERWKLVHVERVAQTVIDYYALAGGEAPAAIAAVDGEAGRLKWVGIDPRRQGGDAYMLRFKIGVRQPRRLVQLAGPRRRPACTPSTLAAGRLDRRPLDRPEALVRLAAYHHPNRPGHPPTGLRSRRTPVRVPRRARRRLLRLRPRPRRSPQ